MWMKKITFLLLAGLTIGIYFYEVAEKLPIPKLFQNSLKTAFMQIDSNTPLQVPIIKSKNRNEADPSYVPHELWHNNALTCSSCHQSQNNQIFSTSTCISCHDGTLGFYNVNKKNGESPFHSKSEFDGQQQKVRESEEGNRALTCSDCHNPHGSYSDRLLHNNPFGTANIPPDDGGYLAKGKVFNYSELVKTHNAFKESFIGGSHSGVWFSRKDGRVEDTKIPNFILVRGSGQQLDLVDDGVPPSAKVIIVYQYMELPATNRIPNRRGYYIPSKLPWLYGYDYGFPQNHYWTRFFIDDSSPENLITETIENGIVHYRDIVDPHDEQWNKHVIFNYSKGFVYATDSTLDSVTSGEVAQTHSVILDKVETRNYAGVSIIKTNLEELSQYKIDRKRMGTSKGALLGKLAVNMTKYCSSCHVPYLAGKTTGKFSFAHRNFSDFDKWNCLKCHYGH